MTPQRSERGRLPFAKYQGLGNDFILLVEDPAEAEAPASCVSSVTVAAEGWWAGWPAAAERARSLCDRHRGIGADGVIVLRATTNQTWRMSIWNADGSRAEMCGNGARCAAQYLWRLGLVEEPALTLDTEAGPHRCERVGESAVRVFMAVPSFVPGDLPMTAEHPLIDTTWVVGGASLRATAVSLGNPHLVVFDAPTGEKRDALAQQLARDPRFPEGVNVGFAEIDDGVGGLRLEVFERGAGWTKACGTGACAAAATAVRTERLPADQAVAVALPGGMLRIGVHDLSSPVTMEGDARFVFHGEVP